MNSSQFMDKQITALAAAGSESGDGELFDLKKEEILPSYDFQPIRTVGSSSSSAVSNSNGMNLDAVAKRSWGSADSKSGSAHLREDDFGGDYPDSGKRSGDKRAFGDLEEEEDDDVFGSKKGKKAEESGGAATGMILSLRESLQNCKDDLAKCQAELEDAQSEIRKWYSAFQNGPAAPSGANPEPALAVTYLQNLKSSEESLREKLEKAKKREAAFIVTYAKREQEIADLKSAVRDLKKQLRPPSIQSRRLLLDPAIHEEFTRLKNLAEEKEKKVKELQDNIAAVNFSANSRMGKMLMAKCRTLQEENEEIGAMASEGKIHELGMKIAVLNSQNTELRSQFDALHKHMDGLTNDVEKANEMAFILQDKLEAKDHELKKLNDELHRAKEMLAENEVKETVNVDDKEMPTPKEASPEVEMPNCDKELLTQEVGLEKEMNCNDDNIAAIDEMDPANVDIET